MHRSNCYSNDNTLTPWNSLQLVVEKKTGKQEACEYSHIRSLPSSNMVQCVFKYYIVPTLFTQQVMKTCHTLIYNDVYSMTLLMIRD